MPLEHYTPETPITWLTEHNAPGGRGPRITCEHIFVRSLNASLEFKCFNTPRGGVRSSQKDHFNHVRCIHPKWSAIYPAT